MTRIDPIATASLYVDRPLGVPLNGKTGALVLFNPDNLQTTNPTPTTNLQWAVTAAWLRTKQPPTIMVGKEINSSPTVAQLNGKTGALITVKSPTLSDAALIKAQEIVRNLFLQQKTTQPTLLDGSTEALQATKPKYPLGISLDVWDQYILPNLDIKMLLVISNTCHLFRTILLNSDFGRTELAYFTVRREDAHLIHSLKFPPWLPSFFRECGYSFYKLPIVEQIDGQPVFPHIPERKEDEIPDEYLSRMYTVLPAILRSDRDPIVWVLTADSAHTLQYQEYKLNEPRTAEKFRKILEHHLTPESAIPQRRLAGQIREETKPNIFDAAVNKTSEELPIPLEEQPIPNNPPTNAGMTPPNLSRFQKIRRAVSSFFVWIGAFFARLFRLSR